MYLQASAPVLRLDNPQADSALTFTEGSLAQIKTGYLVKQRGVKKAIRATKETTLRPIEIIGAREKAWGLSKCERRTSNFERPERLEARDLGLGDPYHKVTKALRITKKEKILSAEITRDRLAVEP